MRSALIALSIALSLTGEAFGQEVAAPNVTARFEEDPGDTIIVTGYLRRELPLAYETDLARVRDTTRFTEETIGGRRFFRFERDVLSFSENTGVVYRKVWDDGFGSYHGPDEDVPDFSLVYRW